MDVIAVAAVDVDFGRHDLALSVRMRIIRRPAAPAGNTCASTISEPSSQRLISILVDE